MSTARKLLFASVTLLLLAGTVEGIAQAYWWMLERQALDAVRSRGEAQLANDAINFLKQADGLYGYILRPGVARTGADGSRQVLVNAAGFAQSDEVPLARADGELRIVAMGESTTHGHRVDSGNYPARLKRLIESRGAGYSSVSVINAGVSGWLSDQSALQAERRLVGYDPDIVVLYAGWNDFQSYDPFAAPPAESAFVRTYGTGADPAAGPFKSLVLAGALYRKLASLNDVAPWSASLAKSADRSDRKRPAIGHGTNLLGGGGALAPEFWSHSRVQAAAETVSGPDPQFPVYRIFEHRSERNTRGVYQRFEFRDGEYYALSALFRPVRTNSRQYPVERDVALAVDSQGAGINIVVEYDLEAVRVKSEFGRVEAAGIEHAGNGWFLAWMYWRAPAHETATVHLQLSMPGAGRIYAGEGRKSALVARPQLERIDPSTFDSGQKFRVSPEETYRFFIASLDRIVAAYRKNDPKVRIVVSTLVSRWPDLPERDFASPRGGPGWMHTWRIDQQTAALALARFNDLIRAYARENGLALVDPAGAFAELNLAPVFDRRGEFGDFLHMFGDGYELLSEFFYEALRKQDIVKGAPSPRLAELYARYSRTAPKP